MNPLRLIVPASPQSSVSGVADRWVNAPASVDNPIPYLLVEPHPPARADSLGSGHETTSRLVGGSFDRLAEAHRRVVAAQERFAHPDPDADDAALYKAGQDEVEALTELAERIAEASGYLYDPLAETVDTTRPLAIARERSLLCLLVPSAGDEPGEAVLYFNEVPFGVRIIVTNL